MVNLSSVHNELKFLRVSLILGLEVPNTPETANVLGGCEFGFACFFFLTNGKYSVSKKFRLSFCQLIFCRLSCYIVELFFCCSQCMIKFKAFHENIFIFGSTGLTQVLSTQLPLDKYSRIFFERRRLCFWTSFSQIDHHSKKNLKL